MPAVEIRPDVFWIGMNDRTTDLFEGIWPIASEGVTYNSYLVRDERSAVIDLAKAIKTDQFLEQVDEIVPLADIDYLVINHMEPDHTGAIRMLSRIPRRLTILTTEKAKTMLAAYYGITENVRVVADGETVDLRTNRLFEGPFLNADVGSQQLLITYKNQRRLLDFKALKVTE